MSARDAAERAAREADAALEASRPRRRFSALTADSSDEEDLTALRKRGARSARVKMEGGSVLLRCFWCCH